MSKRSKIIALLAVIAVVACVSLAAKDNTLGIAEKQTIRFSAPTVVGGTLLPAGEYTVTHQMNGQTHVMLFTAVNGKVEAKSNCKLVPLKNKAERSEQHFITNAKNERVLQEMTFAGDKATHVLAQ
jgi:hypothetical protein